MDAGFIGKGFLAPALRFTKAANILPQTLGDIHAQLKTRVSTIDLQTISDNLVDCRPLPSMGNVTHRRRTVIVGRREET